MSGRRRSAFRRLIGILTVAVIRVSGALPYSWTRPLGSFFGLLAYCAVPRIRRVGLANLDLAYGDALSEREKRRILKRSAQHIATVGLRFAQSPKLDPAGSTVPFHIVGEEHIDNDAGGLLITAHLGNWEYFGLIGHRLGKTAGGVVRPFDDPRVDHAVDRIRRSSGFETIPKDGAGARLMELVRNNGLALVLIDQSPRDNGVPTTFFGRRCWSTFAPALIALRTRAPIYPAFVVEDEDGGYTLLVRPAIEWTRTGDMRFDLVEITQRCQNAVEEAVRAYPEQWLWFHRRWKARPRLEAEWRRKEERERARAANL